jgi:acyl-coenzyme A thioesterase PaaI-like protein
MAELLDQPVAVKSSFAMPDFTNRIIFRQEYLPAHRSRVFEIRELADGRVYMICFLTDTGGRMTGGELNLLSGGEVHPGSLITILDETLGWAGFLSVWQGGVTVDLSALFLRPVRQDEILFSVGLCEKVSGSFKRRILNCSGCMFSLGSGVPEPVIYATGKWFTRPDYKERLLDCLLPKGNLTQARAIQRRMHPGEGD